jgi:hypothetical protein
MGVSSAKSKLSSMPGGAPHRSPIWSSIGCNDWMSAAVFLIQRRKERREQVILSRGLANRLRG